MRKAAPLAVFAILGLSACTQETTRAARVTDDQVEDTINRGFNGDASLAGSQLSVDADVKDSEITLSGTVNTQAQRMRAVEIAKSAQPRFTVTDKIDVKPAEATVNEYTPEMAAEARTKARQTGDKIGETLEDAWIHSKISTKLVFDPDTPKRKINVDVVNGMVTLRGTVPDAEAKQEAEKTARETNGVKGVTNNLRVVR